MPPLTPRHYGSFIELQPFRGEFRQLRWKGFCELVPWDIRFPAKPAGGRFPPSVRRFFVAHAVELAAVGAELRMADAAATAMISGSKATIATPQNPNHNASRDTGCVFMETALSLAQECALFLVNGCA